MFGVDAGLIYSKEIRGADCFPLLFNRVRHHQHPACGLSSRVRTGCGWILVAALCVAGGRQLVSIRGLADYELCTQRSVLVRWNFSLISDCLDFVCVFVSRKVYCRIDAFSIHKKVLQLSCAEIRNPRVKM